ncbi:protein FAM161A-like isoform X2 [Cloeon dipterum]|uniref:protein FAM161A-like isoform X2 n=1 Tax=Cloeon dipterum TaxID=197152 RepID=UPI00321FBE61
MLQQFINSLHARASKRKSIVCKAPLTNPANWVLSHNALLIVRLCLFPTAATCVRSAEKRIPTSQKKTVFQRRCGNGWHCGMAASRASFYHSCLKVPVHPGTKMPSPGYERPSLMSDSPSPARGHSRSSKIMSRTSSASCPRSRASSARITRPPSADKSTDLLAGLAPVLKFYESIPDYNDLNHLDDKDFYARVRELRFLQRNYISSMRDPNSNKSVSANWKDGLQGSKCPINTSRAATPYSASSSSLRTGSPWAKIAWGQMANCKATDEVFSSTISSPLSSPQRTNKKRPPKGRRRAKNPSSRQSISRCAWQDSFELLSESEDEIIKQAAERARTKNVAWREPQFTVPKPFRMTKREEEEHLYQQLRRDLLLSPASPPTSRRTPSPVKGYEVPLTSRLPMYHAILLEQEKRRERQKRKSKARLLAKVKPFSFDLSPRRSVSPLRKNWKSLPELRELEHERPCRSVFKATPMPWQIYGIEAEIRRQEEEYLRQLRKQVRAEELLAQSCLPSSMQKYNRCRSLSPETRLSRASSAVEEHNPRKYRSPYASTSNSRTASRVSSARRASPIRNNLAAVLRIESCRRRAEREAALRLEEARQLEEVKTRAKVMRRRPAWRRMANVSARRDLALRTEVRREEERSRRDEHARHMGSMMNRVLEIPTLFERQQQEGLRYKLLEAKAKEGQRRKQHELRKHRISFSPEDEKKDDEPEFEGKDEENRRDCEEIEEELEH